MYVYIYVRGAALMTAGGQTIGLYRNYIGLHGLGKVGAMAHAEESSALLSTSPLAERIFIFVKPTHHLAADPGAKKRKPASSICRTIELLDFPVKRILPPACDDGPESLIPHDDFAETRVNPESLRTQTKKALFEDKPCVEYG